MHATRYRPELPLLLTAAALSIALTACDAATSDAPTGGSGGGGATSSGEGGAACAFDPTYKPSIDPAKFKDASGAPRPIDHPLYPLIPGTEFKYLEGTDVVTVVVSSETKVILGVTAVVVHDTHRTASGDVVEDTLDWFAQDEQGNVWYFGEDTKEYENGVVSSTEGSWEAGVDGAQPGIVMLATPKVGDSYRQEYYACEAEDEATVISTNAAISAPLGDFTGCLETYDFSGFDPRLDELKFYCPGVGLVAAITLADASHEALTQVTPSP